MSSKYYYIYNYKHFIDLINKALKEAFRRLTVSMPTITGISVLDATVAPYLDFDPLTNRVILHADQVFYDESWAGLSAVNVIGIYFNERLYDLFVGLPYEYVSETGELNYRLKVAYNNNNLVSKNILMRSATNPLETAYKNISFVQMQQ